jgi:hypothetical protein
MKAMRCRRHDHAARARYGRSGYLIARPVGSETQSQHRSHRWIELRSTPLPAASVPAAFGGRALLPATGPLLTAADRRVPRHSTPVSTVQSSSPEPDARFRAHGVAAPAGCHTSSAAASGLGRSTRPRVRDTPRVPEPRRRSTAKDRQRECRVPVGTHGARPASTGVRGRRSRPSRRTGAGHNRKPRPRRHAPYGTARRPAAAPATVRATGTA